MPPAQLLLGEPDWRGMLVYAVIFFGSTGAFLFTVRLIYVKVFRGREEITTISPERAEATGDERR